jgi:glycosyltransferase involved in cell wall biosynthesis
MINIIGDMFTPHGYGNHMRGLANALNKLTKVRVSTQLQPGWEKIATDREVDMLKRKPEEDEINLIITHPLYWKFNLGKRNWAYLVWEGDKIPDYFFDEMANPEIEKIIVPSNHTRTAIRNTITDKANWESILSKVIIVPHGVDLNLFYPKDKPSKVTFFCNKGWRNNEDRGGMQYAIKAYIEEFTDLDDVEMILKINPVYGIPDINKLISELTTKKNALPRLKIDTTLYKQEDLVKIYNDANVFLSPSRAEAFGIPMLEALACGLAVVASNFGGQTDFVNEENGWLIEGKMEENLWDIEYEGISWLTPSVTQLRKVMREIYNNPKIIAVKGSNGLTTASKLTWEASAKKILNELDR